MLSIFHPKSPGHDGAILINDGRISNLGLHLPLTSDVDRVRNKGTRHSAALGLAQCTDSLVIVISEERGTISFARDGVLTPCELTEIKDQLENYVNETRVISPVGHSPFTSLALKGLSLLIAVGLWFAFAHTTDILQRTFVVPIEYRNLPAHLEIGKPQPTFAEVTLSGSEAAFSLLEPATISVSLEISSNVEGTTQHWVTAKNLTNVSDELRVDRIDPEVISVTLIERRPSG